MATTKPCPFCGNENEKNAAECGKCHQEFRVVGKPSPYVENRTIAMKARAEAEARAVAERFGINPELPAKQRCLEVMRKLKTRIALPEARMREPGED